VASENDQPVGTRTDRERIRAENLRLHASVAGDYDRIHPHMRNAYEQHMQDSDIRTMLSTIGRVGLERRVLDIGCGTGNLTLPFAGSRCHVTAVDMSGAMLSVLARKLASAGIPEEQCVLVESDVETFLASLSSNVPPWSVVAMSSVAHHVHDYLSLLEALGRRVATGGFLYLIHEPAHKQELTVAARRLRRAWSVLPRGLDRIGRSLRPNRERTAWGQQDTRYADYHYHREGISVAAIDARLRGLGFELVEHTRYNAHETDVASWLDNVIAPRFRYEQFQRTYFRAIWRRQN
jgi:ubiquinone/menaquinone biosynthesis C-methylase UbiE